MTSRRVATVVCAECHFTRRVVYAHDYRYETPVLGIAHCGGGFHEYRTTAPRGAFSLRSGPTRIFEDDLASLTMTYTG